MRIDKAKDRISCRDIQAMLNDEERFRETDRKELERLELKDEFLEYIEEVNKGNYFKIGIVAKGFMTPPRPNHQGQSTCFWIPFFYFKTWDL